MVSSYLHLGQVPTKHDQENGKALFSLTILPSENKMLVMFAAVNLHLHRESLFRFMYQRCNERLKFDKIGQEIFKQQMPGSASDSTTQYTINLYVT